MATIAQLETAYTAITRLTPSTAQSLILQDLAARSQAGVITDDQAYAYIIGQAQGTTSVAALTYQFFTGKTPTSAGFDYLVNSTTNTTDLNDAAYQNFNLENRYINFAVNLGVVGEGRANFVATFGTLSFADTVAVAYNRIIGNAQATAAKIDVNAAIANIAGRKAYFDSVVAQAGITAADRDLAAKAAVVGYIMAEAVKANVGVYSNGVNNFYLDLAPDGKATYNTDLNTYVDNGTGDGGAGTPGTTFTLVADGNAAGGDFNDSFKGLAQATNNDVTITGGNGADAFTAKIVLDAKALTIDLGAGNDTVTLAAGAGIVGGTGTGGATIALGAGNDTLSAEYSGSTKSITTIDGGDGTDTVTLTLGAAITTADTAIANVETVWFGGSKTVDAAAITGATQIGNTAGTLGLTNVASGVIVATKSAGATTAAYATAGNVSVAVSGSVGALTLSGQGAANTTTVTNSANAIVGGVTTDTRTIVLGGSAEINAGAIVLGAGTSHTINASAATKAVAFSYTTGSTLVGTTYGTDTVTLGSANDSVILKLDAKANATITLGAGNDTVTIDGASTGNIDGYTSGALKSVTKIVDFTHGADHLDVSGTFLSTAGDASYIGQSTLQGFVTAATNLVGAAQWTTFEFGGNTYVLHEGATAGNGDEVLIQLTGTGFTAGANNTFDIY